MLYRREKFVDKMFCNTLYNDQPELRVLPVFSRFPCGQREYSSQTLHEGTAPK
jgi:hypothetical protein